MHHFCLSANILLFLCYIDEQPIRWIRSSSTINKHNIKNLEQKGQEKEKRVLSVDLQLDEPISGVPKRPENFTLDIAKRPSSFYHEKSKIQAQKTGQLSDWSTVCCCLPRPSSILSHSSRMKCLVCFRLRSPLLTNAKIRPGVPTTMCGGSSFRVFLFAVMGIPP